MAAREMVTTIPHPTAGSVPNIRLPFRLHGTPLADPVPAPTLSQHAEEIMRDVLGYPDDRIAALTAEGAVLAARR
jgi:crotonobetainyl-CoA:carnitine CoA-transferase CaiB-like acyl-CoA transferase